MPRTVKPPEQRSAELLDCARRLFFAQGYENTTVNDIIAEAGVSKGAFYHYFASKEALLEALARRLAEESFAGLQPILDDPELDAVARLNALMGGSRRLKIAMAPELRATFDVLFRPENVVLFHRIDQAVTAVAVPVFARILEQGRAEGVFDVTDPVATAETLLQIRLGVAAVMGRAITAAQSGDIDGAVDMLERRIRLFGIAIDRLLKLPDGTVEMSEPGFARALLEARSP